MFYSKITYMLKNIQLVPRTFGIINLLRVLLNVFRKRYCGGRTELLNENPPEFKSFSRNVLFEKFQTLF